ncbi:MAG: hypothetical protein HY658_10835, partial [Actinobacteria bacterium]|nr:hypothetical protein [Actinomycetota bacterium]
VVAAPESAPCTALVTPGRLGTCGFVDMAGGRVAWVVERRPAAGGDAFAARLFTHVASAGGWVERLAAEDADGTRWDDVRILAADVTGDGRPEVLAGFRLDGEGEALSYDIVVYPSGDVPRVAAHPGAAGMGAVLVAGGAIEEYAASYPNDEPVCCPPAFVHRTIRHVDGFFRVVATDTVVPGSVPPSQI